MKQDKIWEYFQGEGIDNFNSAKYRLYSLFSQVKKYKNKSKISILNIGVGSGYFEKLCIESGWEIHSLDIDKNIKDRLTKKGIKVHIGTIELIPLEDNYFDFIVCSEVLEHLSDDQLRNALCELYRVTKSNGYIIGTVPNNEDISQSISVCPNCNHKFHRWGHHQSFTKNDINELFSRFSNIKIKICVFKDFPKISVLNYLKYFIRLVIVKIDPSFIYSNIFFIIKK
jgi:SAM-dependent methyltransferase